MYEGKRRRGGDEDVRGAIMSYDGEVNGKSVNGLKAGVNGSWEECVRRER